jgi:hypothetical protein
MKKWYVGLPVVMILAIITYYSVSNKPVIPLQGQVTTAGFWQQFLTCPHCVLATQGKAVLVLWNLSKLGHSGLMLAWHNVQAQFFQLAIINTSLDLINQLNILTDFTTTMLKVFFGIAFFLSSCSHILTCCTTLTRFYVRLCCNWKIIAFRVFVLCYFIAWFGGCAYFYAPGEHKPALPVENEDLTKDLTTSKDSGVVQIIKVMQVAVGTAVTSAVGYGLLWLVTQGD